MGGSRCEGREQRAIPAGVLTGPDRAFPRISLASRRDGSVLLEAVVTEDGTVDAPCVLYANPPNVGVEQAAVEAVRRWRYHPATVDGEPVWRDFGSPSTSRSSVRFR